MMVPYILRITRDHDGFNSLLVRGGLDCYPKIMSSEWYRGDGYVSGLAYIYLHGSGFFVADKDFGTSPFFNHLLAQGHSVMDVAYRLCPEVDFYRMIGDVKRAVAWMQKNA